MYCYFNKDRGGNIRGQEGEKREMVTSLGHRCRRIMLITVMLKDHIRDLVCH